jgi:hypothetical protein
MLPQDLHADRALPGDHVGIVVGMHEREPAAAFHAQGVRIRFVVRIAVQHHFRAARRDCVHLDARRGHRHDDHRAAAEFLRCEGDALRVIACARRDYAALQLLRRQIRHLVVGTAQLEREHRLQVLALEQQPVAQPLGQPRGELERRLDRHVVDPRLEDALQVVVARGHNHPRKSDGA